MFVSSRVRGPTGQEMVESRSIFRPNKITNTNEFLKTIAWIVSNVLEYKVNINHEYLITYRK